MSDARVTRPYPEARGPHLPDALLRVPPIGYVFAALAVFLAWQGVQTVLADPTRVSLDAFARALIPSVVIPILGFFLVVHHPAAHRTMPLLAFGIALLTFRELIDAFDAQIRALLRGSAPFTDADSPGLMALYVFTGLLLIVGLVYLGAGFASARGSEKSPVERPLTAWLVALAVIGVALSAYPFAFLAQGGVQPGFIVEALISVVINGAVTLCWAYIASVAIGGWLARNEPRRAWIVAGVALVLLFSTRLIGVAALAVASEALAPVFLAVTYVALLGWVLLFVAFALGLPAPRGVAMAAAPTTADPPAATPPDSGAG